MKSIRSALAGVILCALLGCNGSVSGQWVNTPKWTTLANSPPERLRFCLLLTDASVMCQAIQNWYRLTPDVNGSYIGGSWSLYTSFPSTYIPDAYASAVLADGKVAIMGGEYTFLNGNRIFTLSRMGATFDPVTARWQALPPPAPIGSPNHWQCIGDAPSTVLADGRWIIGSKLYQDVAALDPRTLVWSEVTAPGKTDPINSEEGWTLLPDDSVLTLDVTSAPATERLVLEAGSSSANWVSAGPTPVDLATVAEPETRSASGCPPYNPPGEMGPALLMPNGAVFAVGANGTTAIYSPSSNAWAAGPVLAGSLNVQDGPAVLLPSGHVLFGASPGASGTGLAYFEFDGTQLLSVPPPARESSDSTGVTSLLLLPTGQALFVDRSATVQVYTPAPTPTYESAWTPVITSAPSAVSPGSTYQLMGTQFNGLSQGSAYGDEYQNSTNYPLVRITNVATKHIFYARTHDHSTMGVATGTAIVITNFDVPMGIESGPSTLQVVANGIPSPAVSINVN